MQGFATNPIDIKFMRQLCKQPSFVNTVGKGSVGGIDFHVVQFNTSQSTIYYYRIILDEKVLTQTEKDLVTILST